MKKVLLYIILTLGLSINSFASTNAFSGGDGTTGNPYQISTWNDLVTLAGNSSYWSANFIQTSNITAGTLSNLIGTSSTTPFSGTYNGLFNTITGLTINKSGSNNIGLFGYLSGATISDLNLQSVNVQGSNIVGGLFGIAINSTISKCSVDGTITASNYAGTMGGQLSGGSITNCYAITTNSSITNGSGYIGGIVGYNTGTISYSYSRSVLGLSGNKGAICGNNAGTISNCTWDTEVVSSSTGVTSGTISNSAGHSSSELKSASTYTVAPLSWNFSSIWTIDSYTNNNYPYLLNTHMAVWNGTDWGGASIDNFTYYKIPVIGSGTYPTFSSSRSCSGIEIEAGAKLTIASGATISTSNNIILKSTDSQSAQVISNGTMTLGGKVIFRKTFTYANKWYFIAFPYSINTSSNIKITSSQNSVYVGQNYVDNLADLYIIKYDGNSRDQLGPTDAAWVDITSGSLSTGIGYAMYVNSAGITLDFNSDTSDNSAFRSATYNESMGLYTTNSSTTNHSWNLAGVPYTSAFNVGNLNQGQFYYIYDKLADNYTVQESTGSYQIDPFSSFFLQAESTTLTFDQAGRTYKAKSAVSSTDYESLQFVLSNANYSDKTEIRLADDANVGYELNKDAAKFFSLSSRVPQIWSKINNYNIAINRLPSATNEIYLSAKIGTAGTYSLNLNTGDNFNLYNKVTLIDTNTNTSQDLTSNSTYTFTSAAGTFTNRFKVLLQNDVTTSTPTTNNDDIKVYAANKAIYVEGLNNFSLKIYDLSGKLVKSYNNINDNVIPVSDLNGLYLVQLVSESNKLNYKLKL